MSRTPTGPGTTFSQPLIQNIRYGATPGTRKPAQNGAYRVSQKHVTNDIRLHTSEINNQVNYKTGEL